MRGVTSTGTLGRFSTTPSRPLQPPNIGFNLHSWKDFSVEDQDKFIVSQLTDYLPLVPNLPLSAKKPWISEDALQLIADLQSQQFTDNNDIKQARKRIKKAARKNKNVFISRNLENNFHGTSVQQWDHARSIRSPFKPKVAALYNTEGKLVSKTARAVTVADYFADKVWYSETDSPVPPLFLLWKT